MCPAWLLLACAALELSRERRLAAREPLENSFHVVDRREGVLTLGAGPQLSGRLGTAQEQHGEHGELAAVELERPAQEVGVLVDTAARPDVRTSSRSRSETSVRVTSSSS